MAVILWCIMVRHNGVHACVCVFQGLDLSVQAAGHSIFATILLCVQHPQYWNYITMDGLTGASEKKERKTKKDQSTPMAPLKIMSGINQLYSFISLILLVPAPVSISRKCSGSFFDCDW